MGVAVNPKPGADEILFPTWLAGESTSTFDLLWRLNEAYALPAWSAVLAVSQNQGRGQMRRPWQSPPGNLYVSFLLPRDPVLAEDSASLLLGYILLTALREVGYDLQLKWPNDILLPDNSKVAGFLLEQHGEDLVAGLGINLAFSPADHDMRRDFASPAGKLPFPPGKNSPFTAFPLWQKLVNLLNLGYSASLKGRKPAEILREVERHLAWRGRRVLLKEDGSIVAAGLLVGLSANGGILIQDGATAREFFSGSLSLA